MSKTQTNQNMSMNILITRISPTIMTYVIIWRHRISRISIIPVKYHSDHLIAPSSLPEEKLNSRVMKPSFPCQAISFKPMTESRFSHTPLRKNTRKGFIQTMIIFSQIKTIRFWEPRQLGLRKSKTFNILCKKFRITHLNRLKIFNELP